MQDPYQIQQRFGGHSMDIMATLLTAAPVFERRENDRNNGVWGLHEWRVSARIAEPAISYVSKRNRGPRAELTAS